MLNFRLAKESDVDLYFAWANDETVRENSFSSQPINYEEHVSWFLSKLSSKKVFFYLFSDSQGLNVGQVRIEQKNDETVIGISIDKNHRGKSYGTIMLEIASNDFYKNFSFMPINAYIKISNLPSLKIFTKAGFKNPENQIIGDCQSIKLTKFA